MTNLTVSNPVMIPHKVLNHQLITIYGIITGSLASNFSCVRYIIS